MTNALEALEQHKYSLKKEVDLKTWMLESLQSDYESLKNYQKRQLEEQQEHLEWNHNMATREHHSKIVRLQSALEESQLNEKQLKHKLELQTETLNNKMEELRALNEHTQNSMTSEMMEVQMRIMELENIKVELEQMLQECRHRVQQLELHSSGLQRQLDRTTEEKEEREKEAVSWFNALEKSREVNRDLQIQLGHVLQQAQDPNSKGNSLFAELEDKRAEMERRLISMKVQFQSLQKVHTFNKQQMQRMKVQIATLMQLQCSRADPAQMERLQSMLSEKNGEIQDLIIKLQKLEKLEVSKSQPVNSAPTDGGSSQDETYYIDLLKLKLHNAVKAVERLSDELSLQRMKSLSESQRALALERKLFKSECLLKQAQSDKFKLQLHVEDLEQKYEPKEMEKPVQRKCKIKLPDNISERSNCEEMIGTVDGTGPKSSNQVSETESELRPAKCVKINEEPDRTALPRSVLNGQVLSR
ncbi:protein Spindly [Nematolebias whitei]|uniref:protein Spindly n=1 Tax=Nematolebias whitei TaxID=451745 RepID=UPI001897F13F|nr:protein Spindly [Nematolebias whitei]